MRNHYLKHYVLLFAMLLVSGIAFAQTGSITGTVTDNKGVTLPGVTLTINGTSTATATDINGAYKLNMAAGTYTVVANYIGYTTQQKTVTVTAGQSTTLGFLLDASSQSLNEIVVIGYGTQQKKDLTGSVATVSSKDFQKGVVTTPEQLIAGKVAGVAVTSNGGAPGAGSTIRIRGGASLNASNDPLIVIDGVPLSNTAISGSPNPLSLVNPNDIETFSVLKDASATAIYGSRASNGVILITTKKGAKGAPQINFNTQYSLSKVRKLFDVLSADQVRDYINKNGTASEIAMLGTANTNWQKEIYQTAATTDNNLSVAGSVGNVLPYRISAGYLNQEGIIKTSKLERTTLALNLNPTFLDNHLKVNLNVKGAESKSRFADQGVVNGAATFDPTQPVYSNSSRYGGYFEWLDPTAVNGLRANSPRNPVGLLEQTQNNSKAYRSIGNLQLDYKLHFLPDVHANVNFGYDISKGNGTTLVNDSAAQAYKRFKNADDILRSGVNNQYKSTSVNKTFEAYLSYNKDMKNLNSRIEAVAGYAFYDYENKGYNFGDYSYDGVLQTTSAPLFPYGQGRNKLQSYYARVNYTFMEKYLLTATVRTDGSSRFSPDNKYATFPSAAFAWRIKEESFLKNVEALSDLKLKVGYGITGQQDGLGDFDYRTFYSLSDNKASYQFGDTYYNSYRPNGSAPDRKWEQTATTNLGLDYGFLNGRISGSIEVYYKKTKDLLNEIEQPAGTNFSNKFVINVGDMENRGIEFNINGDIIKTKDLTWSANFNATFNKNKITNLFISSNPSNPGNMFGAPSRGTGSTVQINAVGSPRGAFYVLQQVYDDNGKPIDGAFVDRNKDGVLDLNDRYIYKQPDPKGYFGFSSNVTYKKWSAGFVARAQVGNYVYNDIKANAIQNNILNKLNFISNVGTDILYTGFTGTGATNDKYFLSDYFVENASFIKMDNVNLGYNFGNVFGSKGNLRVSANVQNVFVITNYTGIDPEVSSIDRSYYPRPRTYVLGLNLSL